MNQFRKLPDATWGLLCETSQVEGSTIQVELARGGFKPAKVGKFLYSTGRGYVYQIANEPAAPRANVQVGDLSGILSMFATAKQHLRFPAITLQTDTGLGIRINVAGERARQPGTLTVVSSDKGADGRAWYGRVQLDGRYEPSRDAPPSVGELIRKFAADPDGTAAAYGKLTGRCCYCNRALSDERSTAVGYGPICADHFGRPWGEKLQPLLAAIEAREAARAAEESEAEAA